MQNRKKKTEQASWHVNAIKDDRIMIYGDIKASLQTIKYLYESRDIFVNDNYNESSRHYPNVLLHISGRISCNSGTSRPSIGRHEETWWYSRLKYSGKILIPEML